MKLLCSETGNLYIYLPDIFILYVRPTYFLSSFVVHETIITHKEAGGS